MKYISGETEYEYFIEGICIPKNSYTQEQIARGKSLYVPVEDNVLAAILKNPTIKDLVAEKKIIISDKPPSGKVAPEQRLAAKDQEIKELEQTALEYKARAEAAEAQLAKGAVV